MLVTIISIVLVVYGLAKSLYIANTRRQGRVLNYDISVLGEKEQREFYNLVSNLLSNITFFIGVGLYFINLTSDYGIYFGILFIVGVIVLDYVFIKNVFPKEYKNLRG